MLRRLSPLVAAGALSVVVGCGDDGKDETSAKQPSTTGGAPGLERFLLRRGEEPGYEPSGPVEKLSTAEEFAERSPRPEADARRLSEEGFVSFTRRQLEGKDGAGVTSVLLFKSVAGAKGEAAHERRNLDVEYRGWTLKRFDVPGVPGAFGWTATNRDASDAPRGERVGNVTWVEGRCAMTLGNAGASEFVPPLTAGVKALHRRIAGRCP